MTIKPKVVVLQKGKRLVDQRVKYVPVVVATATTRKDKGK